MLKPRLTQPFLDYFKKLETKQKTCLEIGAGYSTFYFAKHFKYLSSLEDNKFWFDKVNQKKPKNVDINILDKDNLSNIFKVELEKKPDFVIIDNNTSYIHRFDIAVLVHLNKKNDCIIILDNGDVNLDAFWFLKSHYFCLDFFGKNYANETTTTSIFFTDKNSSYIY